jgi:hypothetical protein
MVFLSSVDDKAASSGWNADLLLISNQDLINPKIRNLIQQHWIPTTLDSSLEWLKIVCGCTDFSGTLLLS